MKPANILVSNDGTVHLTDFGIARDEDAREPTVDERLLGTLSYMAPEQAAGHRATGATDVWSAGLTLYATLTGRNPFRARSLAELLDNQSERAVPLHRLRPDLPRDLSRTLERAMHRDPGRRARRGRAARSAPRGRCGAVRDGGPRLRARGRARPPAGDDPVRAGWASASHRRHRRCWPDLRWGSL